MDPSRKKKIQAFETKCLRKLLYISYLEQKANDWVCSEISFLVGPQEPRLVTVKETEACMVQACHTPWQPLKNHLQGTLGGGRHRGQQRKCWIDNNKEWTSLPMPELLTRASCRKDWRGISAELSLMPPPSPWQPQTTPLVKKLNWLSLLPISLYTTNPPCCFAPCRKWGNPLCCVEGYKALPLAVGTVQCEHTHTHTHTNTSAHTHTHTHTHKYAHTHTNTHTHTCMVIPEQTET